jgi:aconitate decarboxylase
MSHHYTEGLAEFIATIEYDAIPPAVLEHAKLLVLDTLGCGLLGAALPWSLRLRAALEDVEQPGDALVWGSSLRLSAPSAAMANATAVHGFELDDVGPGGHNGSVVLTSGLALAEHQRGISGKALLTAVVAGVETAARVQHCVGRVPHVTVGFHGPSIIGTFAATAAACRVLGLRREQVVHALGHAGQQTAGLMATQHGGMGKRLLAGKAAHSGMLSALLASHGFTNVENIFECEYGGFCSAFSGARTTYKLEELVKGLGSVWHTPQVTFKMWACRVPIHPTLEGLRSLRQTHALQADQVESIRVWLDEGAYKAVGFPWVPTTVTSAQMNLAYCASVALLEGDVFLGQFTEGKLTDPRLLDLTKRIETIHDTGMDAMGSFQRQTRLEVELKDGRILRTTGATRGGPDHPILPADVTEKFRKVTNRHLPPRTQDELISQCDRLEALEDATALTRFLGM